MIVELICKKTGNLIDRINCNVKRKKTFLKQAKKRFKGVFDIIVIPTIN